MIRSRTAWLGGLLLLAFAALPVRAADIDKIDKYLPADSESVVSLNIKQLLDSGVVKKIGLERAKEALKSADEVAEVLKQLGFDPFRDLDQIIVTSPGGKADDKGLIIVHGKFDEDKFKAKAEEVAKDHAEELKIHKSGKHLIYEVKVANNVQEVTLFVTVAGKDTVLAGPGKDYVVDALKQVGAKTNPGLKNAALQTMVAKMDQKQSLSLAMVGEALANVELGDKFKELFAKIEAISGGITVTDDVKMEFGITTKTADGAKSINKEINDNLNMAIGALLLLAGNQKELAPVLDFVKSVKATAKDKSVLITGSVSAETIDKALEKKDF